MAYGIIYKATSPDGRVYIGQTTKTLAKCKGNHACRAKKEGRRNLFYLALLKWGFENFKWQEIDFADSKAELDYRKKIWASEYSANQPYYGYNQRNGLMHCKDSMNPKCTPEARRNMSEAHKG